MFIRDSNGLAAAKAELGSLSKIRHGVRVGCFVACENGFGDQPKVANAASGLPVGGFGEQLAGGIGGLRPVSYTHLPLPTTDLGEISVVAGS